MVATVNLKQSKNLTHKIHQWNETTGILNPKELYPTARQIFPGIRPLVQLLTLIYTILTYQKIGVDFTS